MKKAEIFDFEKLTTSGEIDCACGQKHSTDMKILTVGRGVIEQLPDALRRLNVRRPMIVSGPFSFPAVGKKVCAVLDEADFVYSVFVFERNGAKKLQPAFRAGKVNNQVAGQRLPGGGLNIGRRPRRCGAEVHGAGAHASAVGRSGRHGSQNLLSVRVGDGLDHHRRALLPRYRRHGKALL